MEEYSTIRKIWGVIYPLLIYLMLDVVVNFFVGAILGVWFLITNKGSYSTAALGVAFSKYLEQQSTLILLVVAVVLSPIFYFLYRRDAKSKYFTCGRKRVHIVNYVWLIPLTVAVYLFVNQIILAVAAMLPESSLASFEKVNESLTSGHPLVQGLTVLLFSPIVEELLFRGIVYRRLTVLVGNVGGIIGSALLFGVFHGNLIQGIYAFIVGVMLAWIFYKYQSIYAPILMHMGLNGIAQLIRYIPLDEYIYSHAVVKWIVIVIEVVIIAICLKEIMKIKQETES